LLLVSHAGVEPPQSLFWVHPPAPPTHLCVLVSHVCDPLQSPMSAHSTQRLLCPSQTGVLPEQSALLLQPPPEVPHVFVAMLHVPFEPQSKLDKHSTQVPRPEHRGAPEFVQSLATSHSTHWPAALQIGRPELVQSLAVRHSTQMLGPLVAQNGVAPLQSVFAVHAVVHWRAETLHVCPAPQSVSARQATHRARVMSQTGVGAAHAPPQFGPGVPPAPGSPPLGDPPLGDPPPALAPPGFDPDVPLPPNPPAPGVLASAPPAALPPVASFAKLLLSPESPQAAARPIETGVMTAKNQRWVSRDMKCAPLL
jgi:hypothetical protein